MLVTKNSSDREPLGWDIVDDLVHLREWGTTRIYPLVPRYHGEFQSETPKGNPRSTRTSPSWVAS